MSKIVHSSACTERTSHIRQNGENRASRGYKVEGFNCGRNSQRTDRCLWIKGSLDQYSEKMGCCFLAWQGRSGGRPPEWYTGRRMHACTQCNTEKVLDLVMNDHSITVRQLSTLELHTAAIETVRCTASETVRCRCLHRHR